MSNSFVVGGSSAHWQIPHVVEEMVRQNPTSVLDVGPGQGKFGMLAREYLPRLERLDCAWAPITWNGYERHYLSPAEVLPNNWSEFAPYDLALLVDVVEHLEQADGHALLRLLTRKAKRVLVTTPLGFRPQAGTEADHEEHKSGWWPWDFLGQPDYRVRVLKVYPGHYTRRLGLPRLWQQLVVLEGRST